MEKIKVLVVDDIDKIVNYFSMVIASESDMILTGTASSGQEAVEKALELNPDIVLMDIQMETDDAGIIATKRIKELNPNIKIIILTVHDDDDLIFNAYTAGAMDFIIKTASIASIVQSIRKVYLNTMQMRPEIAEKIVNELTKLKTEKNSMLYMLNLISKLTSTEIEIIKLVYSGYKYAQIAKMRSVETATIRTHVNHILQKLGYRNMKETIKSLDDMGVMGFFSDI